MITVTLGTINYPFERAVNWLKLLLDQEVITEPVFIQHGSTDIQSVCDHKLVTTVSLLPSDELAEKFAASRLVISHAGQGSTRKLAARDQSFVIIPRLAQNGEHVDDHQLLFSEGVKQLGVTVCMTIKDLETALDKPPAPLQKDLFSGLKLSDFLANKYANYSTTSTN